MLLYKIHIKTCEKRQSLPLNETEGMTEGNRGLDNSHRGYSDIEGEEGLRNSGIEREEGLKGTVA